MPTNQEIPTVRIAPKPPTLSARVNRRLVQAGVILCLLLALCVLVWLAVVFGGAVMAGF